MISEYTESDTSKILHIINDASLRYKDIIPDNCWHKPYMSEKEFIPYFILENSPEYIRVLKNLMNVLIQILLAAKLFLNFP